jgi:hypothetical protein
METQPVPEYDMDYLEEEEANQKRVQQARELAEEDDDAQVHKKFKSLNSGSSK